MRLSNLPTRPLTPRAPTLGRVSPKTVAPAGESARARASASRGRAGVAANTPNHHMARGSFAPFVAQVIGQMMERADAPPNARCRNTAPVADRAYRTADDYDVERIFLHKPVRTVI